MLRRLIWQDKNLRTGLPVAIQAPESNRRLARPVTKPHQVKAAPTIGRQCRAMVWTGIEGPLIPGGSDRRDAVRMLGQATECMIPMVGLKDMAPQGDQAAIILGQSDPAALAGMMGQAVVPLKTAPAINRNSAIHRCSAIGLTCSAGPLGIALIDPQDMQPTSGIETNGLESMGDDLPIFMHRDGRAECSASIA